MLPRTQGLWGRDWVLKLHRITEDVSFWWTSALCFWQVRTRYKDFSEHLPRHQDDQHQDKYPANSKNYAQHSVPHPGQHIQHQTTGSTARLTTLLHSSIWGDQAHGSQ